MRKLLPNFQEKSELISDLNSSFYTLQWFVMLKIKIIDTSYYRLLLNWIGDRDRFGGLVVSSEVVTDWRGGVAWLFLAFVF